jgi:hypothetical protein
MSATGVLRAPTLPARRQVYGWNPASSGLCRSGGWRRARQEKPGLEMIAENWRAYENRALRADHGDGIVLRNTRCFPVELPRTVSMLSGLLSLVFLGISPSPAAPPLSPHPLPAVSGQPVRRSDAGMSSRCWESRCERPCLEACETVDGEDDSDESPTSARRTLQFGSLAPSAKEACQLVHITRRHQAGLLELAPRPLFCTFCTLRI